MSVHTQRGGGVRGAGTQTQVFLALAAASSSAASRTEGLSGPPSARAPVTRHSSLILSQSGGGVSNGPAGSASPWGPCLRRAGQGRGCAQGCGGSRSRCCVGAGGQCPAPLPAAARQPASRAANCGLRACAQASACHRRDPPGLHLRHPDDQRSLLLASPKTCMEISACLPGIKCCRRQKSAPGAAQGAVSPSTALLHKALARFSFGLTQFQPERFQQAGSVLSKSTSYYFFEK